MNTLTITVFVTDAEQPSEAGGRALAHARAAAARFPGAEVRVLSPGDEEAEELGLIMEPTVLVGDLVVAVGQAPPAGHLVRALQAASPCDCSAGCCSEDEPEPCCPEGGCCDEGTECCDD